MASIRNIQTGEVFHGPDDAEVPSGYELIGAKGLDNPNVQARNAGVDPETARSTAERTLKLLGQVEKPKDLSEAALTVIGAAPIIRGGGAGAAALIPSLPRLAPALGRVATAIGLAKTRGEDNTSAALEGAGAGMAEGAAQAIKPLARSAEAMDFINKRIGPYLKSQGREGWLEHVVEWMGRDPNPGVQLQRAKDIYNRLKKIDWSRESAPVFLEQIVRGAKLPFIGWRTPAVPVGASRVAQAATSPMGTSIADAAMSATPAAPVLAIQALPGDDPMSKISGAVRMTQ